MSLEKILLEWEPVIGLEVHAQLNTRTKLFSRAQNRFGDEPNTHLSIVCTGQPGALPLLNRAAVRKGIQLGLALGSNIQLTSTFDRKSYFYPDSPRNFQITQYYAPLLKGGSITAWVKGERRQYAITRAHLEDDAGMLKHFTQFAGVDYNRAGVPLIEIVSEPCLHSAEDAVAYLSSLKALLQYTQVSDANMEQGHLRVDCNISVRKRGEKGLRPRIEIKNMNSFGNLQLAVESEIVRQVHLYEKNPQAPPEQLIQPGTYRFDLESRQVLLMRRKEAAEDYRYCPEPDLPPLVLNEAEIEELRKSLPELPHMRVARYLELGIPFDLAWFVVHEKSLCDYFERGLSASPQPRSYANWVLVEFLGRFKDRDVPLIESGVQPGHIAELTQLIADGTITGKIAKAVADEMVKQPGTAPGKIVADSPSFQPMQDAGSLPQIVDQVLAQHGQSVIDYHAGKQRAFGFLVGQVMAATQGKAPPAAVNQLLRQALDAPNK
ncbi:MAG: Asp-tRNA(Asn)/Glu-tRNA(Gln) amidotransferase subunit GatB [Chlamydiia bacterium]